MVMNLFSNEQSMANKPICVVTSTEENRPAGTTWVFADGSEVIASTHGVDLNNNQGKITSLNMLYDLKHSSNLCLFFSFINCDKEFFDQFERTTQGEHFVHPSVVAAKQQEENKQEKEDLNDFMDNFENVTGGENFYRRD